MDQDFATIDQHEKLEETVQSIADTVSDLSKAQATTNASIDALTSLIKTETKNRQAQDDRVEKSLDGIGKELRRRPNGVTVKDMLVAVVVAIGALGTVVAIIAAIGTLGVWIATIISTNVADDLDSNNQQQIIQLQNRETIVEQQIDALREQNNYIINRLDVEDDRNDEQEKILSVLQTKMEP